MSDKDKEPATIASLVASKDSDEAEIDNYFLSKKASVVDMKSASSQSGTFEVLDRLREANMLVPGSQLGQDFLDEYRRIKRPILANATGKTAAPIERGNIIMITSSIAGEGKTSTATNLALSIAQEKNHTVLLVDCDVNKQGVSRLFGLSDKAGLVDVIESDALNIGDVILRTDISGLNVVSAGKHDEYVTELLASQRMSDLASEMASRYDDRIIIFDAPPLLPTPQTRVLAELVGQIVFVVEAGKTPQTLVKEALEMVPEETATGLVMNKSEGMSSRSGYYYGYYSPDD